MKLGDTAVQLFASIAFFVIISIVADAAATAHEKTMRSNNFIVDTDMGLDDVRAVMALLSYDTECIASFVTVEGSASAGKASDNLIGLLESVDVDDIPIYIGSRLEGAAPPWRKTANNLNGAKFPPPRELSADTLWLEDISGAIFSDKPIRYLALGPLSNLFSLEKHYPHILSKCDAVWLPAEVENRHGTTVIRSWNLSWDEESTKTVLESGAKIVVVDIERNGTAKEIFSSLTDTTVSTRWIKKTASNPDKNNRHIFLYDELTTVAAIGKTSVRLSDESYKFVRSKKGGFVLESTPEGNIRIASITDYADAVTTLKRLWQTPIAPHGHLKETPIPTATYIKAFHGHLGPYVVLGFMAGKEALKATHSHGHFGIDAEVYSTRKPPRSCFIDGVQLGSGCTLGKNNITVHETTGVPRVTFRTVGGSIFSVTLKGNVPSIIDSLINVGGVEYAGRKILEMPVDSLFILAK